MAPRRSTRSRAATPKSKPTRRTSTQVVETDVTDEMDTPAAVVQTTKKGANVEITKPVTSKQTQTSKAKPKTKTKHGTKVTKKEEVVALPSQQKDENESDEDADAPNMNDEKKFISEEKGGDDSSDESDSSGSSDDSSDDTSDDSDSDSDEDGSSAEAIRKAVAETLQETLTTQTTRVTLDTSTSQPPISGNSLTHLLPGYTAPLQLNSNATASTSTPLFGTARRRQFAETATSKLLLSNSGCNATKNQATLSQLRQIAEAQELTRHHSHWQRTNQLYGKNAPATAATTGLKKAFRVPYNATSKLQGSRGWFGMESNTHLNPDFATDLKMLQLRSYINPKKFYKSNDDHSNKILQVGTVIEGSGEFYASRLTKKERKQTLTEELRADGDVKRYTTKKYTQISNAGGERFGKRKGGNKTGNGGRIMKRFKR